MQTKNYDENIIETKDIIVNINSILLYSKMYTYIKGHTFLQLS